MAYFTASYLIYSTIHICRIRSPYFLDDGDLAHTPLPGSKYPSPPVVDLSQQLQSLKASVVCLVLGVALAQVL